MTPTPQPWPDVQASVPDLTPAELRRLADSIRQDGVQYPILVLRDGRIIDGHHRWQIAGADAPVQVIDIPEEQAFALAVALNVARRHLTTDQIAAVHEQLRRNRELRRETAIAFASQGMPQKKVSALVGVAQSTVSGWLAQGNSDTENLRNIKSDIAQDHHARKVPASDHDTIRARAAKGESKTDIAREYNVHETTIGRIVNHDKPRQPRVTSPKPPRKPPAPRGSSLSVSTPSTDDAHAWNRALISIDTLLKGLRDRGGMVALARRWSPERRANYVKTLERHIARLSVCRDDILSVDRSSVIEFPTDRTGTT